MFRSPRPPPRGLISRTGPVHPLTAVTIDLAAHYARRPSQRRRDPAHRETRLESAGDLLPLRQRQRQTGAFLHQCCTGFRVLNPGPISHLQHPPLETERPGVASIIGIRSSHRHPNRCAGASRRRCVHRPDRWRHVTTAQGQREPQSGREARQRRTTLPLSTGLVTRVSGQIPVVGQWRFPGRSTASRPCARPARQRSRGSGRSRGTVRKAGISAGSQQAPGAPGGTKSPARGAGLSSGRAPGVHRNRTRPSERVG